MMSKPMAKPNQYIANLLGERRQAMQETAAHAMYSVGLGRATIRHQGHQGNSDCRSVQTHARMDSL